jgi:hypothetical protein
MDIPGAMTPEECMEELELHEIRGKPWHITYTIPSLAPLPSPASDRPSNALSGDGVDTGIEWLCDHFVGNRKK